MLVGAVLTVTVTLAACSDTASGGGSPTAPNNGSVSVNPTFNNVDAMFAQMMIPHHEQAVEMASLAEMKAADPDVKQLADKIIAGQKAEIATMKGWLVAWGQPTTMPSCPGMHCMPSMMPNGKSPNGMMPSGMMPSGMPTMPGPMSGADMAKLQAATGTDFDKLFLQMMVVHHQGAITMAQAELAHGTNPDAKALASRIVKTQQAEIVAMQQMAGQLHS
ncbi:DUF305 domain-containing protein [Dactylosporangium siamense]|uniref:DUF305 domain-containing protein n=2 Tax=Dactylosporangium siamense TaxID=685454 RepID=A0A919PYY6_9ACTN|nr:hypothetical protein Dsi01nite_109920 [Dactylosporangium siamense]